jgi:hypothetical protein
MLHEPQQQPGNSLKLGRYRGLNKSLNKEKEKKKNRSKTARPATKNTAV